MVGERQDKQFWSERSLHVSHVSWHDSHCVPVQNWPAFDKRHLWSYFSKFFEIVLFALCRVKIYLVDTVGYRFSGTDLFCLTWIPGHMCNTWSNCKQHIPTDKPDIHDVFGLDNRSPGILNGTYLSVQNNSICTLYTGRFLIRYTIHSWWHRSYIWNYINTKTSGKFQYFLTRLKITIIMLTSLAKNISKLSEIWIRLKKKRLEVIRDDKMWNHIITCSVEIQWWDDTVRLRVINSNLNGEQEYTFL